jgi:hypothetical protein
MLSLLRQLGRHAIVSKKFWLVPLVIFLIVFGGILVLAQNSAVAPLIYAIF